MGGSVEMSNEDEILSASGRQALALKGSYRPKDAVHVMR